MKFTNKDGVSRYGRYTIVPEAGEEHLDAATAAAKGPDYLFNELNERLAKGPIKFKITVQVAEDGDVVNDATVHWPAERKVVELGTIALTRYSCQRFSRTEADYLRSDSSPGWD